MAITVDALTLNVKSSADSAATSVQGLIDKLTNLKSVLGTNFAANFGKEIQNAVSSAMKSVDKTIAGEIKKTASSALQNAAKTAPYSAGKEMMALMQRAHESQYKTLAENYVKDHSVPGMGALAYQNWKYSKPVYSAEMSASTFKEKQPIRTALGHVKDFFSVFKDATKQFGSEMKDFAGTLHNANKQFTGWAKGKITSAYDWTKSKITGNGGRYSLETALNRSPRELLEMKQSAIRDRIYAAENGEKPLDGAQIADLVMQYQKLNGEIEKASNLRPNSLFGKIVRGASAAKDSIKNYVKEHTLMLRQFGRVARMRAMRAIIREITSALKEGIGNLYQYSKTINGSFASSMDSASTALLHMKNSIATAVAPVIEALMPILKTVTNAVVEACNWLAQFIALISGKTTWTRAKEYATEYAAAVEDTANGVSDSVKGMLASFDELNVIASEAGRGSGSGSSKQNPNYSEMFEEVDGIDSGVIAALKWMEEHLPIINAAVAALGAALLGLPTTLTVGLALSYSAGYDIGLNGLNTTNLLEAVGGVLATALGGTLIGFKVGGGTGALIGLSVGLVIGLVSLAIGINEGQKDALYGSLKLSKEEIQSEVDKLFAIDVNAAVKNAKIDHESIETAKQKLDASIRKMNADYVTFKIKADATSAEELAASVKTTVDEANALLEQYQTKISIGFSFDSAFNDPALVQQFSVDKISGLEGYITGLGNSIGSILEDGIIDAVSEADMLSELMKKLTNVTTAIETGKAGGTFAAQVEKAGNGIDWTDVSRQSLQEYQQAYIDSKEALWEAGYTQATDTKGALKAVYAGMVQRNLDEPGTYSEAEIKKALENYKNYDVNKAAEDYVNAVSSEGAEIFTANMTKALSSAASKNNFRADLAATDLTADNIKQWFQQNLATNLGYGMFYGDEGGKEFINVMDIMEITGWELLGDDVKKKYINEMVKVLGRNSNTYKQLKQELDIPIEDILNADKNKWKDWTDRERGNYINALSDAYGSKAVIAGLKNRLQVPVSDLLNVDAKTWKSWTSERRTEYVEAIVDAYDLTNAEMRKASNALINYGSSIPANLAKGIASDKTFKTSLTNMLKTTDLSMKDIQMIVNDTKLIAPVVQKYGYEESLDVIKTIASVAGTDTKTILENWDLIADRIDDKDIEQSVADILTDIKTGKLNWQTELDKTDLTAPDVKTDNTFFSTVIGAITGGIQGAQTLLSKSDLKTNPVKTQGNIKNDVKTQTQEANTYLKQNPIVAKVDADTSAADQKLKSLIEKGRQKLDMQIATSDAASTVTTAVNKARNSINNEIYSAKNSILGEIATLADHIDDGMRSVSESVHGKTNGMDSGGSILPVFGSGGFPTQGQAFIARENGPELVGRIGSSTAVANNEQIVAGISGGVQRAMRGVEDRLARIERYTGITADKDFSVKLSPSVGLARINAQAAAMYSGVTGR